jgi:hypothetical protein
MLLKKEGRRKTQGIRYESELRGRLFSQSEDTHHLQIQYMAVEIALLLGYE